MKDVIINLLLVLYFHWLLKFSDESSTREPFSLDTQNGSVFSLVNMKFLFITLAIFLVLAHSARVTDLLTTELSLKNGVADITIQMKQQVDFSKLSHAGVNVHEMGDSPIRGHVVMNALQVLAKVSQKDIIALVESEKLEYEA